MGIRRTRRDDWALAQIRNLGRLQTSEEILRDPRTTSARLVALHMAHVVTQGDRLYIYPGPPPPDGLAEGPRPAQAFGHHTPDRPLRWLEPLWEPTIDRCDRGRVSDIRNPVTFGGRIYEGGSRIPVLPTCTA